MKAYIDARGAMHPDGKSCSVVVVMVGGATVCFGS